MYYYAFIESPQAELKEARQREEKAKLELRETTLRLEARIQSLETRIQDLLRTVKESEQQSTHLISNILFSSVSLCTEREYIAAAVAVIVIVIT
jgi:hypothetical protein